MAAALSPSKLLFQHQPQSCNRRTRTQITWQGHLLICVKTSRGNVLIKQTLFRTSGCDVIKQGIAQNSTCTVHLFSYIEYLFLVFDKHNNIDLVCQFHSTPLHISSVHFSHHKGRKLVHQMSKVERPFLAKGRCKVTVMCLQ